MTWVYGTLARAAILEVASDATQTPNRDAETRLGLPPFLRRAIVRARRRRRGRRREPASGWTGRGVGMRRDAEQGRRNALGTSYVHPLPGGADGDGRLHEEESAPVVAERVPGRDARDAPTPRPVPPLAGRSGKGGGRLGDEARHPPPSLRRSEDGVLGVVGVIDHGSGGEGGPPGGSWRRRRARPGAGAPPRARSRAEEPDTVGQVPHQARFESSVTCQCQTPPTPRTQTTIGQAAAQELRALRSPACWGVRSQNHLNQ